MTSTRAGSTPCRSAIHSRSGGYPNAGPYESAAAPSRSIAERAQSASSSTGMQSGAGMPRAKEIDPIGIQSRGSSGDDLSASVSA